jgi:hypothetical protein
VITGVDARPLTDADVSGAGVLDGALVSVAALAPDSLESAVHEITPNIASRLTVNVAMRCKLTPLIDFFFCFSITHAARSVSEIESPSSKAKSNF